MENWKPIVGWEGIYEVSDLGRIKRIAAGTSTHPGRIMAPCLTTTGYRHAALTFRGRMAKVLVHRLVAEAFIGQHPVGLEVNHKDGNPLNNALSNLEYVTRSENLIHRHRVLGRHSTARKGERNGRAKLSREQAMEIRRRYSAGGVSQQRLADEFGVCQVNVGAIIRRAIWPD